MADLSKELSKELNKDFAYCEDALGRAENAIGNLPSVQPEKRTKERTETHACDLIDRQAAIDVADAVWSVTGDKNVAKVWDQIKDLPSVQPEIIYCKDCKFWTHIKRTKRHWCKTDDGLYDLNTSADDFCSRAERREE